jgi:hypothetical protein
MEGEWHNESAFGGLDDAIVVQNEVAWGLLDELGLGPGLAIIAGEAHVRAAVDPTVLDAVKHGELATGKSQQRDAHDVVACGIFHHGDRRTPGAALIVGMDAHEARGALVAIAAVELRVDEEDAPGRERGEGTFGVARVFLGRFDVEGDEALGGENGSNGQDKAEDAAFPNRPGPLTPALSPKMARK